MAISKSAAHEMAILADLTSVCNKHGIDVQTNTPDFILADMLFGQLQTYATTMKKTMSWQHWPSLAESLGVDKPTETPRG